MSLRALAEAGAEPLLQLAADEVEKRGLSRGVVRSGDRVDAMGAIYLAAGAKLQDLNDDPVRDLAPVKAALADLLIDALESQVGGDIAVWSDASSAEEVAGEMRHLASTIAIAVI